MYLLKAGDCGTEKGNNCCAPSCLNGDYAIDMYTPDGNYVDSHSFVWPGCTLGGLTDRSNMAIKFPDGASATDRAGIVGGMMLIEYAVMEYKRQREKDNNNRQTGHQGAPPSAQAMSR